MMMYEINKEHGILILISLLGTYSTSLVFRRLPDNLQGTVGLVTSTHRKGKVKGFCFNRREVLVPKTLCTKEGIMTKEDSAKSPKIKKAKDSKVDEAETEAVPYEVRMRAVTPISKPMANEKQTKRLYKLVKRSAREKIVRRGVKEVCKGIRTGKKGICIIAGDITPIDVISHMAYYCEEQGVNYIYVPSKVDLGAAAKTKRPTSCVLVTPPRETKEKQWDSKSKQLFADVKEVCIQEMSQVPS